VSPRRRATLVAAAGIAAFVGLVLAVPVPDEISVAPFDAYGSKIADGEIPYRDFSLEYPPGAIPVIALPAFVGSYGSSFRALQTLLGCLTVAAVAVLLRRGSLVRLLAGVGVVAALPLLLGSVVTFRYDLWPAALVTWSLVAVEAARVRASTVLLGAAIAAKAWAAALALPFAAYAGGRLRWSPLRAGALVALAALALTLPFFIVAPGGVVHSVVRQGARDLQLESVLASVLLVAERLGLCELDVGFSSGSWNVTGASASLAAAAGTIAGLAAVVWAWVLVWRGRASVTELRTSFAAIVAIVLVFAKVLSPQFVIWLVPLVAVVPGALGASALALSIPACVLTQLVYPARYEELVAKEALPVGLVALRNGLLVAIAAVLACALVRSLRRPPGPTGPAPGRAG